MATIAANTAKLANKCAGTTGSKLIELQFEWKIINFSFFAKTAQVSAKSPIFSVGRKVEYKLQLELKPYCDRYKDDPLYITVMNLESGNAPISGAKFKLYISNADKTLVELYDATVVHKFFSYPPMAHVSATKDMCWPKLLDPKNKLLPDDSLTLVCHITFAEHTSSEISDPVYSNEVSEYQLPEGFGALYESSRLSNVTLIAKCGRKFRAHKAILAAQSPVFLAMFDNDMKEKQKNQAELMEFDANVLDEMLRFIYTGKTTGLADTIAGDLVAAADMFQLESLKSLCLKKLETTFSTGNAVKLLILADLYRSDRLKMQAINFICAHIKQLVETESFNSMRNTHQHLMNEVVLALAGEKI